MTYYLDEKIVKETCHPVTVRYYSKKDDPIAPFEQTNLNLLNSALGEPKWKYHKTIERKVAILHYSLVKNHPFHNGNKRVAVVCVITFLYVNDWHLDVKDDAFFKITKKVSESDPKKRDDIINTLETWFKEHIQSESVHTTA